MRNRHLPLMIAMALAVPGAALAQLGLPAGVEPGLSRVGDGIDRIGTRIGDALDGVIDLEKLNQLPRADAIAALAKARLERIAAFVRGNRDSIALDRQGNPARRDRLILTGASESEVAALRAAGYTVESEAIPFIDVALWRVKVPDGQKLADAMKSVGTLAPSAQVSSDAIYFQSGAAPAPAPAAPASPATSGVIAPVGVIDGGVAQHPAFVGPISQRSFAGPAVVPSAHGTAVASLVAGGGAVKGASPGAPLLIADVYGRDPAGGGALAIARALGWLAGSGARVVTMSLVGPDVPLLAQAVRAAQAKGVFIIAPVGNDGPAAPPAYPASYPKVISVTGVDGRNRVLIEAGRALHVDYGAPGADMDAAAPGGKAARVRGTSFAAPLVAGLLYRQMRQGAANPVAGLDAQAKDLGKKGPDPVFGRGLLCETCRGR